jgi:hypothetical protein
MFAMPFDLPDSHPVREQFYLRIAGKTPAQMKVTAPTSAVSR